MPNRGAPTPPVELPERAGTRLNGTPVLVPSRVVSALAGTGATVETDDTVLAEHGRDWWPLSIGWAVHDGQVPTRPGVVVRAHTTEQVVGVLRIASAHRLPVTAMGGRSGVCGASLPVHGGIALDVCGLNGIVDVDEQSLTVDVMAGTFGDVFEDRLRAEHRLTLGHWPQSIALSTIGGWLACRSAGQYSTRYGKIEDMIRGIEVVLADGRVVRTGHRGPKEAAGPDLTQLFVGSEGTLGVITRARLQVWPVPEVERRAAFGFASFPDGLEACRLILRAGATPAVLRLYDERESARNFGTAKPGERGASNVLLVLDEGTPSIVDGGFAVVESVCAHMNAATHDPAYVERWLGHRNDVSQLESVIRNDIVVDTIEIAAPWRTIARVHEEVTAELLSIPGTMVATCHQSHAYPDGACLYFTFAGRPPTTSTAPLDRDTYYRTVWDRATTATLGHGGTVSHHHGIGLNRGRFMRATLGEGAFEMLCTLKSAYDPLGILNPGKLGLPDPFGAAVWP